MKLTPESKKIAEIFPMELNTVYSIPIYQRNYSWKENNIEQLFNDLNEEKIGYYLGNLLVTPKENEDLKYDIVDGQQRLTTIALFLLGLYDYYTKLSVEIKNNSEELESIYGNKLDIKRKLITTNRSSKLELLEPDYKIFLELLKLLDDKEYKPYRNRVFGKRFSYIQELFKTNFYDERNLKKSIYQANEFLQKLNNAEILRITVNNLTDAFSVFTSFNAKGLPLTLIDLLKSYYLSEAVKNINDDEAINKWDELLTIFFNVNDEPISSVVTQFLQNNYDTFESTSNASITKNESLKEYESLFSKKTNSYIEDLIYRAKIFSYMSPQLATSEIMELSPVIGSNLNRLVKLESTQIYPIVLYLLVKYNEGLIKTENLNKVLKYLVNYFVRRNIVLKPKSSNIRAKAIQCVREFDTLESLDAKVYHITKKHLGSISSTDLEFETALKGSVYETSKQTTRLILIDLEREYGKSFNKQNPDNLDETTEKGNYIWTLEHIMPQTPNLNKDWSDIIREETDDPEEIQLLREEHIHKLGNLTLTGYNPEMSARSFKEKRDYKSKNSDTYTGLRTNLFLNDSITTREENISDKNKWTFEDINRRTKYLAEKILQFYEI